MTDKEKLEKVKAEIERRKKEVEDNIFELGNFESERIGLFDNKEIYNDLLSFIDSMQKEPKECMYSKDNYTDEDRKVLCGGCEEECKYVSNIPPVFDEGYWERLGEKPVSEDLEQVIHKYEQRLEKENPATEAYDFASAIRFGANWQKQQMEAYRIEHCKSLTNEQAELEDNFVSSHVEKNNRIPTFIDAIEYGMEYCKQQMMKNAFSVEIGKQRPDYKCVLNGNFFKYDTGDKVKLIIIKED